MVEDNAASACLRDLLHKLESVMANLKRVSSATLVMQVQLPCSHEIVLAIWKSITWNITRIAPSFSFAVFGPLSRMLFRVF